MTAQMSLARPVSESDEETVETAELLELLGDEYTRRVLAAVADRARSGRDVMNVADVSRATVYRRLGALEDAGLVRSEVVFDPDGNHHKKFHAVVESVDVGVDEDGVSLAVETEDDRATALER